MEHLTNTKSLDNCVKSSIVWLPSIISVVDPNDKHIMILLWILFTITFFFSFRRTEKHCQFIHIEMIYFKLLNNIRFLSFLSNNFMFQRVNFSTCYYWLVFYALECFFTIIICYIDQLSGPEIQVLHIWSNI